MEKNSRDVIIENETKGRGLFYGVIAVATFIIMAVGTTFAYFTATTNSADTSVQTGSTTLKLQYIGFETAWMNRDLIPADTEVVEYSFEYQNDTTINTEEADYEAVRYNTLCKDDYGNSICSVYVFQVLNSANSPQSVSLNVVTTYTGDKPFANLNAMAYEISAPTAGDTDNFNSYTPSEDGTFTNPLNGSGDPIFKKTDSDVTVGANDVKDGDGNFLTPDQYEVVYVNRLGVTKTLLKYNKSADEVLPAIDRPIQGVVQTNPDDNNAKIADNITIDGKSTKTFALVLYIKNKDEDQTESDAAKVFEGQVVVSSGDGKVGVSGTIGIQESKELQSGSTLEGTPVDPDESQQEPGTGV